VRMGAGLINIMQQGIGGTVGLATCVVVLPFVLFLRRQSAE